MPMKPLKCANCRQPFVPDRYNRHRQKYCTDAACAKERELQRKRKYYKRRYSCTPEFQARERVRCLTVIRKRQATKPPASINPSSPVPPVSPPVPSPFPHEVLVGLMAQFIDTDDPAEVSRQMAWYGERGRQLAMSMPQKDGSVKKDFLDTRSRMNGTIS